jgi:phosphinothricin acetyltransferase
VILARMKEVKASGLPWLVAEADGIFAGYAYASKWKGRCAYRFSVETTVYLAEQAQGRGIGTKLYRVLLAELRRRKFHVAVGGIALPNRASVRLHEKLGFRKTAHFKEIGYKFKKWIDVGYWQLTL